MEVLGTGAANLDIVFQIGSYRPLLFKFRVKNSDGSYTATDITSKTFSFSLKKNKGARTKIFNLTNVSGITVPIYSTDEILVAISAINSNQEEGEYVWELRREDLNMAVCSGRAFFTFDSPQ